MIQHSVDRHSAQCTLFCFDALGADHTSRYRREISLVLATAGACFLAFFMFHCTWVASSISTPSVFLTATEADGSITIYDDYRDAYAWLRANTSDDARVLSWWDYGYVGTCHLTTHTHTWLRTWWFTVGKCFETLASTSSRYQLSAMANRTTYIDGFTNNISHIARVRTIVPSLSQSSPQSSFFSPQDFLSVL